MCSHCGCQGVPAIAELMAEHACPGRPGGPCPGRPCDRGPRRSHGPDDEPRREADQSRPARGGRHLPALGRRGSTSTRSTRSRASTATSRRPSPGSTSTLAGLRRKGHRLLDDLDVHVEREDLGIFPVSVVTLGAAGWQIVDEAHDQVAQLPAGPSSPQISHHATRRTMQKESLTALVRHHLETALTAIQRSQRPHDLRRSRARPAPDPDRAASRLEPGRAREPGGGHRPGPPRPRHPRRGREPSGTGRPATYVVPDSRHALEAVEDSAVLLTVAKRH